MKNIIFVTLLSSFCLLGCSAKVYKENQVYAQGLNGSYKFDDINNDRALMNRIERANAEFFEYRLNYGIKKLDAILLAPNKYPSARAKQVVK